MSGAFFPSGEFVRAVVAAPPLAIGLLLLRGRGGRVDGRRLVVRRGMMVHHCRRGYGGVVGSVCGADAFFEVVEIARSLGRSRVMLLRLRLLLRLLRGMRMHVDNDGVGTGVAAVDAVVGIVRFGIGRRLGPSAGVDVGMSVMMMMMLVVVLPVSVVFVGRSVIARREGRMRLAVVRWFAVIVLRRRRPPLVRVVRGVLRVLVVVLGRRVAVVGMRRGMRRRRTVRMMMMLLGRRHRCALGVGHGGRLRLVVVLRSVVIVRMMMMRRVLPPHGMVRIVISTVLLRRRRCRWTVRLRRRHLLLGGRIGIVPLLLFIRVGVVVVELASLLVAVLWSRRIFRCCFCYRACHDNDGMMMMD